MFPTSTLSISMLHFPASHLRRRLLERSQMFGSKVSAVPASFSREAADPLYEAHLDAPARDGIRMATASRLVLAAPRVVLYDGVCNLCNSGIRFVAKRDSSRTINFCAVQSKQAQPYLDVCRLSREQVLQRFVFIQGDSCSRASTAALDIAGLLKFPWPLARVFLIVPVPVRDAVYDFVAHHRYQWFGKTNQCQVPDKSILERCLDAQELIAARAGVVDHDTDDK